MSTTLSKYLVCFLTLTLGTLALAPSAGAAAQDDEKEEGRKSAPTISQRTGEQLNEAIQALNNNDLAGAQAVLADIKLDKLSPYELSRVEQIWSGIAYGQDDYEGARQHLQRAIDAGGFNEHEVSQAKYQIAQIYMSEENWAKGAAALEDWFRTAKSPNSAAYYLLAAAYYQQEALDKALAPAKKAVEMTDSPKPSWVELLLALYLTKEDYKSATPLLEQLVEAEPTNKSYWLRLSSIYQAQEQYDKALAAMQIAYNAGYLSQESDYTRLADMLRFNDIPYRGAEVLQQALKDGKVKSSSEIYEKLANSWIQARDFDDAIQPLERAAQLSKDGELYMRLGQVQVQREEWADAVAALRNAVDKGGLDDEGQAQILMGIAFFNQDKFKDARDWFQRASRSKEHRKLATDYIKLIDSRST